MQMARFFESRTVSSILRSRGSLNRGGEYDDTIQKELDRQLQDRGRPVQPSEVFPTSAGHPKGDLTLVNKARVLLHVAAVQSVAADARVIPFKESHQIASSVRSALDAMATINAADGVFSPVGTAQRIEQERLASMGLGHLRSIVFPLLGTGQGGATAAEVVSPMLDAIIDFLGDARNEKFSSELQDIYIAAYTQEDVNVVTSELGRRLRQTIG